MVKEWQKHVQAARQQRKWSFQTSSRRTWTAVLSSFWRTFQRKTTSNTLKKDVTSSMEQIEGEEDKVIRLKSTKNEKKERITGLGKSHQAQNASWKVMSAICALCMKNKSGILGGCVYE